MRSLHVNSVAGCVSQTAEPVEQSECRRDATKKSQATIAPG